MFNVFAFLNNFSIWITFYSLMIKWQPKFSYKLNYQVGEIVFRFIYTHLMLPKCPPFKKTSEFNTAFHLGYHWSLCARSGDTRADTVGNFRPQFILIALFIVRGLRTIVSYTTDMFIIYRRLGLRQRGRG